MRFIVLVGLALTGCEASSPAEMIDAADAPSDGSVDAPPDAAVDAAPDDPLGYDPATCRCDREIAAAERVVDLAGLAPGSVVCLRAATASARGALTLTGLNGSEAAPILIRNCDGAVTLTSNSGASALAVTGQHFRISGGGAIGVPYGLRATGAMTSFAISIGRASGIEVDRVEVFGTAFAGLTAKQDPSSSSCAVADRRFDAFVMRGLHLHHNFAHDLPGEGFYVGNSFYGGAADRYCYSATNTTCDRTACPGATEQFPHELRDVRIHHNLIERTGWDGIQVGSAVDGCVIADNRVIDYGRQDVSSQNHGIQLGGGSSCVVERNLVMRGPKALNLQGIGGSVIRNNWFADFTVVGADINPRPTPLATDIVATGYRGGFALEHNTWIAAAGATYAIEDINAAAVGDLTALDNHITDQLVVFPTTAWFRRTDARYGWDIAGTQVRADRAAAGLVGVDADSGCVAAGSPAIDAALGPAVSDDLRGRRRPLGAQRDVGALECQ